MDEYLNTRQKEIFHNLLANPADTGSAYANSLYELVKAHPQSGLFRALYARAMNDKDPAKAGAYFDSRALHKLYHQPDALLQVDNSQIVVQIKGTPTADLDQKPVEEAGISLSPGEGRGEATNADLLTDQPLDFPEILNVSWMHSPGEKEAADIADTGQQDELVDTNVRLTPEQEQIEAPEELPEPEVADNGPATTENTHTEETIAPAEVSDEPVAHDEALIEIEEAPIVAPVVAQPEPATEQEQPVAELPAPAISETPVFTPVSAEQNPESDIEDDVFDEITGIDDITIKQNPVEAGQAPVATAEATAEAPEIHTVVPDAELPAETETPNLATPVATTPEVAAETPAAAQPVTDEAEKLILGNIAATDYFVFDRAFGDNRNASPEATTAPEPAQAPTPEPEPQAAFVAMPQELPAVTEPLTAEQVHQDLSKYHDEKMPYTFMWWLDKTRKEHGSLYQPYTKNPVNSPVSQNKNTEPVPDALQQQYFENIFHISSVDELAADTASQTIEFDMQSKEDRIIQRFITEDPHIHPPVGEKLDTENKAKKSSEDNTEMVTETLAKIYADQMLYPKAIATYKKLMLKYPEKSRYFASRIENLEKKTN